MKLQVTFFHGSLGMDVPVLSDRQELIYISSECSLEDLGVIDDRDR